MFLICSTQYGDTYKPERHEMTKTHPPPKDDTTYNAELPDLGTLLPMLLGDTDHAPDGCDVETYLAMLDRFDIPTADKRILIHTLYTLIETLVGIRFGVDPVGVALRAREEGAAVTTLDMVQSKPVNSAIFGQAAEANCPPAQKG